MITEPDSNAQSSAPPKVEGPEHFRPLKWNEQVRRGDFVKDGKQGFELWSGLVGFRADTFIKTIYRRKKTSS
jgi:hypothetical protein